jgi:sortase (surface protein transpeptidase)
VPAIAVDSPVDQVGLNPDRTMEVPAEGTPGYAHAAWFRYSVTPGRQGPSVIIGHVDSAAAGPSVFYELGRLHPGDRADVVRADGATVTFEVTEVAVYPKDAFPTDRVYGPTPGPELRLITCGGSFDRGAGSYRDNTVVYAREIR